MRARPMRTSASGALPRPIVAGRQVAAGLMLLVVGAGTWWSLGPGTASAAPAHAAASAAPTGNVASYALGTGSAFNWMLPLESEATDDGWESNVEGGMWVPLYAVGYGSGTGIDYGRSIGEKPVYSDDDKTVTVTMHSDLTWSDGMKVTSADVKFFFALLDAGKNTLGSYVPGEMPDDIASITYPDPSTFVLHLDRSYNPVWFTGDQLTRIYPLPDQSWDRTCATCPVGSAADTPTGAKAVFKFLFKQSQELGTYTTNPLWKTVDGPWLISAYNAVTHDAAFTANPHYTGPTPPHLAGYKIYTFTTGTAEVDALRSGTITFGFLPRGETADASYFESHGFVVKPWRFFYNAAVEFGYTSKAWGSLVKQLYIRQALQHLVDEKLYITHALHGYGLPDYGPISDYPGSSYVSAELRKDPYPYSLSAAERLLGAHGWERGSNGLDTCRRPGSGSNECGPGIVKGAQLSFSFMYETGTTSFTAEVSAFQTAARSAGIGITLNGQSLQTMYSIGGVCPSTPPCKYGLLGYSGYLWTYGQGTVVPTGISEFGKGNYWAGGYYTPKAQQLIEAADDEPGLSHLYADENYLSKNVASLWWPLEDTIAVVKKDLKGWEQLSPYGTLHPSQWSLSG
jgi:peptide/nickel transport system substrate-binding protein